MTTPRYSIGPLTHYADAGELRQWFLTAQPREEAKYASGPAIGKDTPAVALARKLAGEGRAELVQRRNGRGFDYIIRKKASPPPSAPPGGGVQPVALPPGSPEERVHRLLLDCAKAGRPCPSYAVIAEVADLPDRHAARYRVRLLEERGLIRVGRGAAGRTVTIPKERERHD